MVGGLGLSWQAAFGVVTALYFYSHYFFASGAAHIGAMYTAFVSVSIACGTPGIVAALALGECGRRLGMGARRLCPLCWQASHGWNASEAGMYMRTSMPVSRTFPTFLTNTALSSPPIVASQASCPT